MPLFSFVLPPQRTLCLSVSVFFRHIDLFSNYVENMMKGLVKKESGVSVWHKVCKKMLRCVFCLFRFHFPPCTLPSTLPFIVCCISVLFFMEVRTSSLSPWPPEKVMLGQREGGSKADLPLPPSCLQPVIARVANPSSTPPSPKAHFSRYFLAELFPASSLLLPLQALAMAASCLKGRRSLLKDVRSSPWKLYTPWGNR